MYRISTLIRRLILSLATQLIPTLAVHLCLSVLKFLSMGLGALIEGAFEEVQVCASGVCLAGYGPCYGYSFGALS